MKVLYVAPHPDDLEFFSGGIVADHVARGDEVVELIVSHGERKPAADTRKRRRRLEAAAAAELLGIRRILNLNLPAHDIPLGAEFRAATKKVVERLKPDSIYIPSFRHRLDFWVSDHHRIGAALLSLLKAMQFKDVRLHGSIKPTVLVDVTTYQSLIRRALRVHTSQQYLLRPYRVLREYFTRKWGRQLGTKYAEGFERV